MSLTLLSFVLVGLLIVLLLLGLPLAWCLGATAMVVCLIQFSDLGILVMQVSRIYDLAHSYSMLAVPLFVMMASLLQRSGIAEKLFNAAYIWVGGFRGGLAYGTITANLIMAAMVGVVGAEIVTLGMVALPQLLKNKYNDTLAIGTLAAGGGLATLIPPSVVFIVYGMTAGVSVADLFIAGILPGVILFLFFILFIFVYCKRYPEASPLSPKELIEMPLLEKFKSLKGLTLPVIITMGVLGSIYMGIATPTEAAGVGTGLVLLCTFIQRTFSLKLLWDSCQETLKVTCMLYWLFFGAQCVIGAYTFAGGTRFVYNAIIGMDLGVWGTLIFINIIWIFLGCFLDWMGILFLTVPIFLPVILSMGLNPIWFGVLYCMNMQVSYLSPPFAPSSFYIKSIAPKEVTMGRIYRGTLPYLVVVVIMLCVLTVWQDLPLYLLRR